MKRYHGEEKVPAGLYFNLRELAFTSMDEAGCLPGPHATEYHKVPAVALLVVGPVLGAAYVMFLPVLGFAMLAWVGGRKGLEVSAHAARAAGRVLEPTWDHTMAFLSRRKRAAKAPERKDAWEKGVERKLEEKDPEHTA
jgi:hypothetical protein